MKYSKSTLDMGTRFTARASMHNDVKSAADAKTLERMKPVKDAPPVPAPLPPWQVRKAAVKKIAQQLAKDKGTKKKLEFAAAEAGLDTGHEETLDEMALAIAEARIAKATE